MASCGSQAPRTGVSSGTHLPSGISPSTSWADVKRPRDQVMRDRAGIARHTAGAKRCAMTCTRSVSSRRRRSSGCGSTTVPGTRPEARVEHLGHARPLRRTVVEEHDAIAERHRARAPREDRARLDQIGDAEQDEAVQQRGDVPAADGDGVAALDDLSAARRCARRPRAASTARRSPRTSTGRPRTCRGASCRGPDRVDRRARLVGQDALGGRHLADDVLGLELVIEPDPVELLPVAQRLLPLAVRGEQLRDRAGRRPPRARGA